MPELPRSMLGKLYRSWPGAWYYVTCHVSRLTCEQQRVVPVLPGLRHLLRLVPAEVIQVGPDINMVVVSPAGAGNSE